MPLASEETKIAIRQELLEEIFVGLRDHLGSDFEHLEINRVVLHNIIVSYFYDVDRHKDFHGTSLVDETKQGAFTMKWITKLRPVQFCCSVQDVTDKILYANEIYAVRCGLAFMKVSPDELPDHLYHDLLYTLRNRPVDERMLFVWLATLRHAINGDIVRSHGQQI